MGAVSDDFVRQRINAALQASPSKDISCVAHFRHHWLVLRFRSLPYRSLTVYDSAPSPMVFRDLSRLSRHFGWPAPALVPCPRQQRSSQECGLFALLNFLVLQAGREPPGHQGEVSLARVRELCVEGAFPGACKHALDEYEQTTPSAPATSPSQSTAAPSFPLGGDDDEKAPDRCTSRTQAKRGGLQCKSTTVAQGLCRMHLLLAHAGTATCATISKAGRPCSHRAVTGLTRCSFHADDEDVDKLLASLDPAPQQKPQHLNHAEHAPRPDAEGELAAMLEAVDDPDFESELLSLAQPVSAHSHGDFSTNWEPPRDPARNSQDVALLTLGDLFRLVERPRTLAHPLALANIQVALMGYLRCLRNLKKQDDIVAVASTTPLVPAMLEVLNRRRRARSWRWATMLRNLCEIQGALQNLPLTHGAPAITISNNPEWSAALKFAASQSRSERPRVPAAATYSQVCEAVRREPRRAVKLLLAMTWLCTGRTGDCCQLNQGDVTQALSKEELRITVTFRHGKTVKKRGCYSLHTRMGFELQQLLGISVNDSSWVLLLKQATVKDVLGALRRVDKTLENRSIRRGALQALAHAGVDEDTLLLFSGHATLAMLRRYLNWGAIGEEKATRMERAAAALNAESINAEGAGDQMAESKAGTIRQNNPYSHHVIYSSNEEEWKSIHRLNATAENGVSPTRWLSFLGTEAPPTEELPRSQISRASSSRERFNSEWLPLASKAVLASANVDILRTMACDQELRDLADRTFPWLYEAERYEHLKNAEGTKRRRRRQATCTLSQSDVEQQIALGKYDEPHDILHDDPRRESDGNRVSKLRPLSNKKVKAWCRVFSVPERSKNRRRHICEPLLNDNFSCTPTIKFSTKAERHELVARFKGGWAVTLDYASCFDQFGLGQAVRPFFGIKLPDGRVSHMNVLPMGFRPAAAIAQTATWCVIDIAQLTPGLRAGIDYVVLSYIDNILILGKDATITQTIATLIVERSATAGLRLNEHAPPRPLHWSPEPTQSFDFLGEAFDLTTGTVRQAEKTAAKIALIDPTIFDGDTTWMTRRELAAVIGLFLFASGCCDVVHRRHQYFYALKYYQRQVRWADGKQPSWDGKTEQMPPAVATNFKQWLSELANNAPLILDVDKGTRMPTDILFVDASEERWSAVHLHGDRIRVYAEDWTKADREAWNLASSVCSEPLGIRKALCRAITPSQGTAGAAQCIAIYTDHQPIVDAMRSPCAHCYAYWKLQCFLSQFPAHIVIRHIPGLSNPADTFTRGNLSQQQQQLDDSWYQQLDNAVQFHHQLVAENGVDGTGRCRSAEPGFPKEWSATARNPLRTLSSAWG